MPNTLQQFAKMWLPDMRLFSRLVIRRPLYRYQLAPAQAIITSVLHRQGREFAVMFPRQSGKNETQSQLEAYLLNLFQRRAGAQIVKGQPTFTPQAVNAMMRLERALNNDWNKGQWKKREGYIFQLGEALMTFFSTAPGASIVGASATLLLEGDEAQDIDETIWGLKLEPMAASTNATTVLWGTAWTSQTMLAKTIKRLRALEAQDGEKRVFVVSPAEVRAENEAYGKFVDRQVAKYGRTHPFVVTQLYNQEIDATGGMFPPARQALMQGSHPRQTSPRAVGVGSPGPTPRPYAFLIDVAGEDEGAATIGAGVGAGLAPALALDNPARDSTTLTIVEVDLSTLADEVIRAPTYRAVERMAWVGVKHTTIYGILRAHYLAWRPRHVVIDATGVGAGLTSFLDKALPPGVVIPFVFNSATKSQLGWDYLAIVETGRWQDWAVPDAAPVGAGSPRPDPESARFWRELRHVQYEAGLNQKLKWGVPDRTRDADTGELVHDDMVISAALSAELDKQPWTIGLPGVLIPGRDPLKDLDKKDY